MSSRIDKIIDRLKTADAGYSDYDLLFVKLS